MKWSTDDRQQLLGLLNTVESVVITFYRLLLWLVIAAVAAVVAFVVKERPWGDGTQGEWFYFSIAVLLVLGWAMSQFVMLSRRQRNPWPELGPSVLQSKGPGAWEFRFGSPPNATSQSLPSNDDPGCQMISKSFGIPLTTLEIAQPPEKILVGLRRELERGLSLEQACQLVEPAFADWSGIEQHAYLLYVKHLLSGESLAANV